MQCLHTGATPPLDRTLSVSMRWEMCKVDCRYLDISTQILYVNGEWTVSTCETPSSDWCSCLVCAAPDTRDAWHVTRDMLWHWQVVTRDTWHVVTRDTWNTRHAARMSSAMAATSVTCSSPMVCGMPATIMNSSAMLCTCGEHGPVSGTALWRSVLELQTIVREDFL